MSALSPKVDIRQRIEHVCLVPLADIVPFLTRPRRPRTIETPLSEGTDGQASHLPWRVRKAGEAAPGADAWSRRRRARRALDDIVQSWDDHTGAPRRACA